MSLKENSCKRSWSKESEAIIELCEGCPDLIKPKFSGIFKSKAALARGWSSVADQLNARGLYTPVINGKDARRKFNDLKYRAKKRAHEIEQSKHLGSDKLIQPLNSLDERIIALLGESLDKGVAAISYDTVYAVADTSYLQNNLSSPDASSNSILRSSTQSDSYTADEDPPERITSSPLPTNDLTTQIPMIKKEILETENTPKSSDSSKQTSSSLFTFVSGQDATIQIPIIKKETLGIENEDTPQSSATTSSLSTIVSGQDPAIQVPEERTGVIETNVAPSNDRSKCQQLKRKRTMNDKYDVLIELKRQKIKLMREQISVQKEIAEQLNLLNSKINSNSK